MKYFRLMACIILVLGLSDLSFAKGAGKGFMGGSGVMQEPPGDGTGETDDGSGSGGIPDDVEGPLTDKGSIEGELYGDLYRILRYNGGETKNVPLFDDEGNPVFIKINWTDPDGKSGMIDQQAWTTATAVGGEPKLTENFVLYQVVAEDTGEIEVNPATGGVWYLSPTPSQCVQPLADFNRWGDLSAPINTDPDHPDNLYPEQAHTELADVTFNRIPLIMTYDPTWDRTEFAVGTVESPQFFIPPGGSWWDPNNQWVTYTDGVLWTDLIQEVSFGRLNQARAPDSVLQAAFDEAIATINSPDTLAISTDASGRLLLTKVVYDEYLVDADGRPLAIGEIVKAIDSPLENLAIYLKLMKDGHLVTPGDERAAIDRSERGGIPLEQMLGLEDGPSASLRPTIDIDKMIFFGFGDLVDVVKEKYYTYYEVVEANGEITDYVLHAVPYVDDSEVPEGAETWEGIATNDGSSPTGSDFEVCASTLSAAADKTGKFSVDKVVYLNNILGINKVAGKSEDGTIDYSKNPVYFDYSGMTTYDRGTIFNSRGYQQYDEEGNPQGDPVMGEVLVLQLAPLGDPVPGETPVVTWEMESVPILNAVDFRELGTYEESGFPNGLTADQDVAGFAQAADDDLSVIGFVHTYQIPENR